MPEIQDETHWCSTNLGTHHAWRFYCGSTSHQKWRQSRGHLHQDSSQNCVCAHPRQTHVVYRLPLIFITQNFSTFLSAWCSSRGVVPDLFRPAGMHHKSTVRLFAHAERQPTLWGDLKRQYKGETSHTKPPWPFWGPADGTYWNLMLVQMSV